MAVAPAAVSAPTIPHDLEAYIEAERRRADVVGASVAAFDRDGMRFAGGFGYADLERGERVTPDTLFRAASISKLFTTTLVLQEIEAGRIGLDDPVNQYLDLRTRISDKHGAPANDVTVRHLLTHTSGLPVSWKGIEQGPWFLRLAVNRGRLAVRSHVEVIEGMRTMRRPGRRIVYANGGFSLLGHRAERVNGEPFAGLVRRRVLEPLGMRNSGFPLDPGGEGVATPYRHAIRFTGAGRRPVGSIKNWSGPAGALLTSAPELARFGQMVLGGGEVAGQRILSESLLQQATSFQARNHPELDEGIGLGFWVSRYRGRSLVGHTGGLAGVATRLDILPEDGVGVVVLTNGADPFYVQRLAERVREMLLGLEPEAVPGLPAGMVPGTEAEWSAFTSRIAGKYRLQDMVPPGLLSAITGLVARPRLSPVRDGVLAMEGFGNEPGFLYPDGAVGRYRVAYPLGNGLRAVIEEKANGTHLWTSIVHLFRPK